MLHIRLIILFLFILSLNVNGQEILTGLGENVRVKKASKELAPLKNRQPSGSQIELPFLDDFSKLGIFPNDTLWADRDVFINSSYSKQTFNIGVATFDALNDTGSIHSNASSPGNFPADTLTSREIRLDSIVSTNKKLSPSDSLYLSFYIQPAGIGNAPEKGDSLVLKFYAPQPNTWIHQWSMTGKDLQTFYDSNKVYMKRVMIPIIDSTFFHKRFKMRFYNYASLSNDNIPSWQSGNVDIWNLDYVYLNQQRTYNDTSLVDWTLIDETQGILKNFEHMPWDQYKAAPTKEMKDTFNLCYRSNKGHKKDVNMTFKIFDLSGLSSTYNTNPTPITNQKMPSFSTYEFVHQLDYEYPPNSEKYNAFELLFHINVPDDPYNFNDTSRFYQRFYNYYAYDDGTPEGGYGLSTKGARLAYQFRLNKPDTLQSIQMYFNKVKNNTNVKNFKLTVWNDNNGKPGNIIYEESGVTPKFKHKLNRFVTYKLNNPIAVSGTFYVGWKQIQNDNLNVGFDKNRNARTHIFYNTYGNWNKSIYEGALMIRPILGDKKQPHQKINRDKKPDESVTIYPNPTRSNGKLHIQSQYNCRGLHIKLYDIQGKIIREYHEKERITLPELQQGIYLMRIENTRRNSIHMKKLIISH